MSAQTPAPPESMERADEAEPDGMSAYMLAMENPSRDDPNWPLPSFDARDWAESFCAKFGGDEELMIGWFANALKRGFDERARRAAPSAASALFAALVEVSDMLLSRPDMVAKLHPLMGAAEHAVFDRARALLARLSEGPQQ